MESLNPGENHQASVHNRLCRWDPDQPHAEKLLGIPKFQSPDNRNYDYEQKYEPDPPGTETGRNARVWKAYLDEAESYDNDMLRGFSSTIDSMLVFASLFAAVVASFVIETSPKLEPDYAQITAHLMVEQIALLRAWRNDTAMRLVPASSFDPDICITHNSADRWINGLFFTSLTISLITALLAILSKQWLQAYSALIPGDAKSKALTRHFRFMGLQKWKLPEIIGILPLLLHLSLALFLAGEALYAFQRDQCISIVIMSIMFIGFVLYFVGGAMPAIWLDCPYRVRVFYAATQSAVYSARMIAYYLWSWNWLLREWVYDYKKPTTPLLSLRIAEELFLRDETSFFIVTAHTLSWLFTQSSNTSVQKISLTSASQFLRELRRKKETYSLGSDQMLKPCLDILPVEAVSNHALSLQPHRMDIDTTKFIKELFLLYGFEDERIKRRGQLIQSILENFLRSDTVLETGEACLLDVIEPEMDKMVAQYFRRNPLCYYEFPSISATRSVLQRTNIRRHFLLEPYDFGREELDHPMYKAAHSGNLALVQLYIEFGASVQAQGRPGVYGPLHAVCLGWNKGGEPLEIATLLLDHGADLNYQGKFGHTPLHLAAWHGHEALVRLFLSRGGDVTILDNDGDTLLHLAVLLPAPLPMMRLLIDAAAAASFPILSRQNREGNTPLHTLLNVSCRTESKKSFAMQAIPFLLSYCTKDVFDMRNSRGQTPPDLAHELDDTGSIVALFGKYSVSADSIEQNDLW